MKNNHGRIGVLWLVICLIAALFLGIFAGSHTPTSFVFGEETEKETTSISLNERFEEIWPIIINKALDPPENTPERKEQCKQEVLAGGFAECLKDKYSAYLTPYLFKELQVEIEGKLGGIGVELEETKDGIAVISPPLKGSPADRSGKFKTGDVIVFIDKINVRKKKLPAVVDLIRGDQGTKVSLVLLRDGKLQPRFFVHREVIKIPNIETRLLEQNILQIHISEFKKDTFKDLVLALQNYVGSQSSVGSSQGVILDLRDNPGGIFPEALAVSCLFSKTPLDIILVIHSQTELESQTVGMIDQYANRKCIAYRFMPLVVLVNGGSASASEIVAGALQSWGTKVIGVKTYEKGMIQTIFPLFHKDALRLTTAEYFIGEKQTKIEGVGVIPDIIVDAISNDDRAEVMKDSRNDPQLQKAIKVLNDEIIKKQNQKGG